MSTADAPRTRIGIPLHRSQRWFDNVVANVRRLEGYAAVTVSDATGDDDCLDRLRVELADAVGVTFLGPRPIAPGWVSHCNDLLARTGEEFFAWLPHDDEIGARWVTEAQGRLDESPDAVLALGPISPVRERGVTSGGRRVDTFEPFETPDLHERMRHALEVCLFGESRRLAAAFRGVMRTDSAVPLPETVGEGEWSDALWAVRMLARGPFAAMTSTYGKRWHPHGAHTSWRNARYRPELRTQWLPEALADLEPEERETLLLQAWSAESLMRLDERDSANSRARAVFETSWSWRVTAPLRRVASILRRD